MSSFPFLPGTISLVDRHSGIHQGTRRCRCSYSTGTITAGNVQIERSRCTETSADAEHLYSITYKASGSWSATGAPDSSPPSTPCFPTPDTSGAWCLHATCFRRRLQATANGRPRRSRPCSPWNPGNPPSPRPRRSPRRWNPGSSRRRPTASGRASGRRRPT